MGEELLGQMVTRGSSMEEMPVLEEDRVRDLIDSANEVFHERFRDLVADLRRSNDALAASRLGSIEGSYRVKLGRYQERLRTGRERNLDPRYVRMAEGAILRLESELAGKRQKIEESRRLSESYELVAGGVVEVRGS
jgi:hypothetical protein